MNRLSQQHSNLAKKNSADSTLPLWQRVSWARVSEAFWFTLSFLLFLVLGPFSAVVVLIGLGSLATEENREQMREPARL